MRLKSDFWLCKNKFYKALDITKNILLLYGVENTLTTK